MAKNTTRVVFTCPVELAQQLSEEAIRQGISKSRLITELLEFALISQTERKQFEMLQEMQKKINQIWSWYLEQQKS